MIIFHFVPIFRPFSQQLRPSPLSFGASSFPANMPHHSSRPSSFIGSVSHRNFGPTLDSSAPSLREASLSVFHFLRPRNFSQKIDPVAERIADRAVRGSNYAPGANLGSGGIGFGFAQCCFQTTNSSRRLTTQALFGGPFRGCVFRLSCNFFDLTYWPPGRVASRTAAGAYWSRVRTPRAYWTEKRVGYAGQGMWGRVCGRASQSVSVLPYTRLRGRKERRRRMKTGPGTGGQGTVAAQSGVW